MSGASRLRRALPPALLVVVAASMVATLSPAEIGGRWSSLRRSLAGEWISPGKGTGFAFDPEYARFLEGVRRRTPPDATIAIVVPAVPDLYEYEAAYQLAPRRVVAAGREPEAGFVAAYRYLYREVKDPDVMPVPNGALFRRK